MSMRRLHLAVGLIALAAFLATGFEMYFRHDHLRGLDASTRLLFRSSHIYLLFAALLNLVLGLYSEPAPGGWRAGVRRFGSALVLLAPPLFVLAFFREPWLAGLDRPYARPAIISSLVGVLCHLASGARAGRRSSADPPRSTIGIEAAHLGRSRRPPGDGFHPRSSAFLDPSAPVGEDGTN
jgi:hypothetical protein